MTLPKDVKEARRLGEPTYFTGEPCKRGHVAERRADNRMCVECHRGYIKRVRQRPSRCPHCGGDLDAG